MFGEAGNDLMIWNPGDGTDLMEGGDGTDTAEVNGGNGAEQFTLTANGTRVRFDRLDPAPFALDIGTTENLVAQHERRRRHLHGRQRSRHPHHAHRRRRCRQRQHHRRRRQRHLARRRRQRRHQRRPRQRHAWSAAGDDTFVWNPGDGSDIVEGQSGADTLQFNGANIAEKIDITANGSRVRFARDVAGIVMDVNGSRPSTSRPVAPPTPSRSAT
jgi:hypothetical protein